MQFTSYEYALFFFACFVLSWSLVSQNNLRKFILVMSSYCFVLLIDWRFSALIFASTSFNFLVGGLISGAGSPVSRRGYATLAIIGNITLFATFKHFGFFMEAISPLLSHLGLERDLSWLNFAVPIGISFMTLQAVSYLVDVYKGELECEKSFIDFNLLMSFFPKLVAGPLVKAGDFLQQLKAQASLTRQMVGFGLMLILLGLIKKIVVADMLAISLVDKVFDDPAGYSSFDVVLAVYGLAIQLYCDISGYCDIAIGCALLLGLRISQNFDRPYSALSLKQFWGRWYSSVSRFFIEYIYRPLGGDKADFLQTSCILFLTFLTVAWWHGTSLAFLAFGFFHAFFMICEHLLSTLKPAPVALSVGYGTGRFGNLVKNGELGRRSFAPLLSVFLTFHIVCIGWVFFRCDDLETAGEVFSSMFYGDMTSELFTPYLMILLVGAFAVHFTPKDIWRNAGKCCSRMNSIFLGVLFGLGVLGVQILASPQVKPFVYSIL